MENKDFVENAENTKSYETPVLEEGKQIYDQNNEDLVSPSFTAVLDTMNMKYQDSSVNTPTNSASFQNGYEVGAETDLSDRDTPEDQQCHKNMQLLSKLSHKNMQLPSPIAEPAEGKPLAPEGLSSTHLILKKIQDNSKNFGTCNFKFPCNDTLEENNTLREDHQIFLIVKVCATCAVTWITCSIVFSLPGKKKSLDAENFV